MSDVDWDLLADHLCGALSDDSEQRRVSQLVATDPAWAEAASQLTGALDQVAADLRALPPAAPMPAQVAARLDQSLRELSGSAGDPADQSAQEMPGRSGRQHSSPGFRSGPGPAPARPSGPGSPRPGSRRPGRRPRTWAVAGLVAASVGVLAAVGLGPLGLVGGGMDEETSSAPARDAAESAGQSPERPPVIAEDARLTIIASGTDYRPDSPTFQLAPAQEFSRPEAEERALSGEQDGSAAADPPDPPLDRLWADPQPCLTEVRAAHEPAPATIRWVDFARFEGDPAVIIWLTTGDGTEWIWVAGPDCGTPPAGPDKIYQSRVQ